MESLKTKQFLNIDQLHNTGLHHALQVNSMSDETDSDEEQKQKRKRVPGLSSPPPLLSGNNDDNHVEDIVMEVDMNSSCNVNVNYNESGVYGP